MTISGPDTNNILGTKDMSFYSQWARCLNDMYNKYIYINVYNDNIYI